MAGALHMPMTVIVLFGGRSDERHVSVASAPNIVPTLRHGLAWFWAPNGAVHDVAVADLLAHERPFEVDYVPSRPAAWPSLEQALDTLPVDDPLFLLGLHGGEGEDGTVQRMMEQRGIRFTGSGSEASAKAFDKARAKEAVAGKVRLARAHVARAQREGAPRGRSRADRAAGSSSSSATAICPTSSPCRTSSSSSSAAASSPSASRTWATARSRCR